MKKRWTLQEKKKLFVVLAAAAISALFGYIETLIPALFGAMPYARVSFAMLLAIFVLWAYSPAESFLVWGVRCLVFGLVLQDGYAVVFEALSGAVAMVVLWLIARKVRFGAAAQGAICGIIYGFVYTALCCITVKSGAMFSLIVQTMLFYAVLHLVLALGAWGTSVAVPAEWLYEQ